MIGPKSASVKVLTNIMSLMTMMITAILCKLPVSETMVDVDGHMLSPLWVLSKHAEEGFRII